MLVGADTAYNQIRDMIGTGGTPHTLGTFFTNNGNPGTILFAAKPIDGYSGAALFIPGTGSQALTGSFWSQTVGWITLQDVALNRTNTGSNIWDLSGYAWSEQAGWIDFSGTCPIRASQDMHGMMGSDGSIWQVHHSI
jgi:hypothetical protein